MAGPRPTPAGSGGRPSAGSGAPDRLQLLGVRHHGPGSARAVRAALEQHRPDVVLIEGPPEADALVALAADPGLRPPVALLAHAVGRPGPGGVLAVRRVLAGVGGDPLGGRPRRPGAVHRPARRATPWPCAPSGRAEESRHPATAPTPYGSTRSPSSPTTAGYDDPERWWEDAVEHRGAERGRRARAVRRARPRRWPHCARPTGDGGHLEDAVREAHMRLRIREARAGARPGRRGLRRLARAGAGRGGRRWPPTGTLLKGLPKAEGGDDLGAVDPPPARPGSSGYGAGIDSPGWYHHLFTAPDRPVDPLDDQGRRPAAGRGPPGLLGARHRGGAARRDARRDARPAARRARRDRPTRSGR